MTEIKNSAKYVGLEKHNKYWEYRNAKLLSGLLPLNLNKVSLTEFLTEQEIAPNLKRRYERTPSCPVAADIKRQIRARLNYLWYVIDYRAIRIFLGDKKLIFTSKLGTVLGFASTVSEGIRFLTNNDFIIDSEEVLYFEGHRFRLFGFTFEGDDGKEYKVIEEYGCKGNINHFLQYDNGKPVRIADKHPKPGSEWFYGHISEFPRRR